MNHPRCTCGGKKIGSGLPHFLAGNLLGDIASDTAVSTRLPLVFLKNCAGSFRLSPPGRRKKEHREGQVGPAPPTKQPPPKPLSFFNPPGQLISFLLLV